MDYNLSYTINDRKFSFDVSSKTFKYGKLVNTFDYDLVEDSEIRSNGYTVRPFPSKWHIRITAAIAEMICDKIAKHKGYYPYGFTLDSYHEWVDDDLHAKIISDIRGGFLGVNGIPLERLGMPYQELDEFINDTVRSTGLSCHYKRYGVSLKHFWIRIIRPQVTDNNPPHKDTCLWRIDRNINIYLPLAGSDENSSLPVIPASHLELDSEYIISGSPCYINNRRFTVPAIVHRKRGLDMITPNPSTNEILIFTPHIIHGGGVNFNSNTTRVSLEMRFFK